MIRPVETRRLETLLALSRLGSMRAVADAERSTTSTVSAQVAALAREIGAPLVEPDGRRVRLTPAGRRLAAHAATILAAVEGARRDVDPDADPGDAPAGTVRVAGFASAIRGSLLPAVHELAASHPDLRVVVHEYEPAEAVAALLADELDLALTYDYDLAPAVLDPALEARPLWTRRWGLGVPAGDDAAGRSPAVLAAFADRAWIGNSRNRADEDVLRLLASMAGVEPRLTHEADSLELVDDLIVAGLGVGLLPVDRPVADGVRVLPLDDPGVWMRAVAVTRRGAASWPPLALVLERVLVTRAPLTRAQLTRARAATAPRPPDPVPAASPG